MVLKGGSSCKNPRAAGYVATPLLPRRQKLNFEKFTLPTQKACFNSKPIFNHWN